MKIQLVLILVSLLLAAACGSSPRSDGPVPTATLAITALAGPVCPVQSDPPQPGCDPLPVAEATIVVNDSAGSEVARGVTGPDGSVTLAVPPGELVVVPQPAEGMMGTARPIQVTIGDGETMRLTADYDTGVR